MGYDGIVKAQTKRDAKEVVGEGNRRGPRRKSSAPLLAKAGGTRKSEVEVAEDEIESTAAGELLLCSATLMID